MGATSFKQLANNAISYTNTNLTSTGVTSSILNTGDGAKFPVPGNGFWMTLWNGSDPTLDPNMEIVLVSARSGDTLTHSATGQTHTAPCNAAILDVTANFTDLQTAVNNLENGSNNRNATVPFLISTANANALTVGPNGTTNPVLNVNTNTSSQATGINVTGAAAGAGLAIATTSTQATENLTIDAKGAGLVSINTLSSTAGAVVLGNSTSLAGVIIHGNISGGSTTITSTLANGLVVGRAGATNPALQVDGSTASSATGVKIKAAAAGSGIALSVISSGTNENMTINALGTGTITLNSGTSLPAGGSLAGGIQLTANLTAILTGSGVPTVTAPQGSLYLRTDGSSTSTRAYISAGSGTWVALTSAS